MSFIPAIDALSVLNERGYVVAEPRPEEFVHQLSLADPKDEKIHLPPAPPQPGQAPPESTEAVK